MRKSWLFSSNWQKPYLRISLVRLFCWTTVRRRKFDFSMLIRSFGNKIFVGWRGHLLTRENHVCSSNACYVGGGGESESDFDDYKWAFKAELKSKCTSCKRMSNKSVATDIVWKVRKLSSGRSFSLFTR